MKVTFVPGQIAPDGLATMLTDGVTTGFTVIVIVFEVAVVGETQLAFEVIITLTTSPIFSEDEVKVAPVPTLAPFTCH